MIYLIIISFEYEAALEQQHLTNPPAGLHATPDTKVKLELKWDSTQSISVLS